MIGYLKYGGLACGALLLSGCVETFEGVRPSTGDPNEVRAIAFDRGRDASPLSELEAGIYIDPDGCHIWMIDDGLEGYWSRRRDPVSGLPVCTEIAPPNSIVGNISTSPGIADRVPR
ncbi:MAG: hypothetical protein NXH79_05260 [Rhodobacteraceae bacterium]|jgi:hypothetical protein|nr:hypothetical protein [Paracoccaceae bacterium]